MHVEARVARGAAVLMVCLAAVLRVWGLEFGFPHVLAQPDEVRVVHTGVEILRGHFDPGFFNYPSLYMYGLGLLDAGYCSASRLAGRFPSMAACAASWPVQWQPFFLLARGLSALAGTVTVIVTWRLGARLFDQATGLAGGTLLAVAFLHVRDSHFGVTDVAMTAMLLAAILLLVRAHDAPSRAGFALAGLAGGLATSTKYSAALVGVAAMASQGVAWFEARKATADLRIPVFAACMLAGFLIGTPYAVIDPSQFATDVAGEARHLAVGHGITLDAGWRQHFKVTLWYGVTWPVLLTALVGVALMVRRVPWRAALLLAFPAAYYVVSGRGLTVFARYMVPVVPFVCLAAGFAATAVGEWAGARTRRSPALWSGALVALLAAAPLVKSMELDRALARTDTRVLAAEWLRQHVPPGTSIHSSGSTPGRPEVAAQGSPNPYVPASYDDVRDAFRAEGADLAYGPDVIVIQESPLVLYSHVPDSLRAWLTRYDLLQSFRGFDEREERVYDQQDAFYLPLANFRRLGRPGPNIFVYGRRR